MFLYQSVEYDPDCNRTYADFIFKKYDEDYAEFESSTSSVLGNIAHSIFDKDGVRVIPGMIYQGNFSVYWHEVVEKPDVDFLKAQLVLTCERVEFGFGMFGSSTKLFGGVCSWNMNDLLEITSKRKYVLVKMIFADIRSRD